MQVKEFQLVAKKEHTVSQSETGLLFLLFGLGLAGLLFIFSQTLSRDTLVLSATGQVEQGGEDSGQGDRQVYSAAVTAP